jgi:hypothetical protein
VHIGNLQGPTATGFGLALKDHLVNFLNVGASYGTPGSHALQCKGGRFQVKSVLEAQAIIASF